MLAILNFFTEQNLMIILWFTFIIITAIIEANTFDLSSIWLTIGALVSLILASFGVGTVWQIITFALVSAVLLVSLRPICKKYLRKDGVKTNSDSLIGQLATVTKAIPEGERGEVKIDGKIWTAISEENSEITVGEKVIVLGITGVKLIVRRNN